MYARKACTSTHPHILATAWIDINLTVTPETVPLLFSLISDPSFPIRLATTRALTKIVSKGLKVPSDKLKLVQVLSLGPVIDQLESQTAAEVAALPGYSENLTSFREALAHLSNALGLELVALCSNVSLMWCASGVLGSLYYLVDHPSSRRDSGHCGTTHRIYAHSATVPCRQI
jgi:hypothetical protein